MSVAQVYIGETRHRRLSPRKHSFSYPLFQFACDLKNLETSQIGRLFSYNRSGILSLHDQDYLNGETTSIYQKACELLQKNGAGQPQHLTLITMPRVLGYVFNPVSYYIAEDQQGKVTHVIAEVNNTFGEKHVYCLSNTDQQALPISFKFPKEFFVSPFFEVRGEYELTLRKFSREFEIEVALFDNKSLVFQADFRGKAHSLSALTILRILVTYPCAALFTMVRIHWQAIRLYKRGLVPFQKPIPTHGKTLQSKQSWIHKLRLRGIYWMRSRS